MNDALFDALVSMKDALTDLSKGVDTFYGDGGGRSVMKDTTRHLSGEVFEVARPCTRALKAFDELVIEARERDPALGAITTFAEDAEAAIPPKEPEGTEEQELPTTVREIPTKSALGKMKVAELTDLAIDLNIAVPPGATKADIVALIEHFRSAM